MNSFAKNILLILIVTAGLAALGVYWTFYRTLPDFQGEHTLQGIEEEVQVHWDYYGIPHIYAQNRQDLYYSLGYLHARDRLWQMTLTQLASEGRLAEFLGKDLLEADLFQRTLGFWRTAQQMERDLSEPTRQLLQTYADGVNTYVNNHPRELPLEFTLTDMEPIPWTVTHSLALARMMAWELNVAWRNELALAYLGQQLSPEQFAELLPEEEYLAASYRRSLPQSASGEQLLGLLEGDLALRKALKAEGFSMGSNAWAVDAGKSNTGSPLLAGDPHLGLSIPGKWYEVHLNLDGRNLSGATLAGAPIVLLGQNDVMAWSLTNVMMDDSDFFLEIPHPEDPTRYLADSLGGEAVYEPVTIQRELVKIKDSDDTTFTRRLTRHGPVISDIHPEEDLVGDRMITMRWTAYDPGNEVEALMGINWAESFEEFQSYLPLFRSPGQNIIYADTAGNIARYTLGAVPVRSGNPIALRKGWEPAEDWQGYLPFDRLPRSVNPESGWVANANQEIGSATTPYISIYWEPGSRYQRIEQYLSQNDELSVQAFQAMQNDTYSHFARRLTDQILPVLRNAEEDFEVIISYLENWDYRYEPSETAATLTDLFMLRLSRNIFEDEMGEEVYRNFISFSGLPARIMLRSLENGSSFFDDAGTEAVETREEMIIATMRETEEYLRRELGEEPYEWRWENVHTITLKPLLFGEAAEQPGAETALKLIVNNLMNAGPYPARGHKMSVNNGSYSWSDPFEMTLGPSIRRVVDLSDLTRTQSIIPTGQSGLMLSEHYGDQTESWLNGEYKYVYQDSSIFRETKVRTMHLVPSD